MTFQNKSSVIISISTSIVLISLICYCLWRGLRGGVMVLWSTWMGSGRVMKIYRAKEPVGYWLLFSFWLLLIPVILGLMFHRIESLLSRASVTH